VNKAEILAFISKNNIAYLATVEGSKPHVRGMETYRADEKGLIFYTNVTKDVAKQILKNPEVEACYFADGIQVRVSGKLERTKAPALLNEIIENRPFLKPMVEKFGGLDYMAVFILKKGNASIFSMKEMGTPMISVDL
jgi:pyridoxamine 5'-phosphate oxidase